MKKDLKMVFILGWMVITLSACNVTSKESERVMEKSLMKVTSGGIVNGIIEDKYGKKGTQFSESGMPTYSLSLKFENAPEKTMSYAVVIEDKDAIPIAGFSWIHWLAANITKNEIAENESISAKDFIQGVNSWGSEQGGLSIDEASMYGGMAPPDKPHIYEVHVYALDALMNLKEGFTYEELYEAMEGHVLAHVTIKGTYSNE